MSAYPSSSVTNSARRPALHAALLAGVSALALLAYAVPVAARPLGYGAGSAAPSAAAVAAAQAASQEAARVAQSAQNALKRATLAVQARQATQQMARDAARAALSTVTDGLSAGGLVVDPRVLAGDTSLWQNISQPNQTTSGGQTTVTLTQGAQRAIATWAQFNVGKNTTLYFDQRGGNSANGNGWTVLNRIDATGSPSQILGQIKAEGTVLIINPNGIIFTGTSQINVHSLIASSMDINSFDAAGAANVGVFKKDNGSYAAITVDGVVQRGSTGELLLAPNNEANGNTSFLNNGLFVNGASSSSGGTLVFSAGSGAGANVGVKVEAGASLSTVNNVSGFDNGGYVALVGPQVSNAGSITTSAGQIILAAGSSAFLTEPTPGSSATSLSIGGFANLVYTPSAVTGGASVVNTADGLLTATRGNITLVGDTVEQLGYAGATTSITRAGSITIAATNTVTFGPGSVTTILPEDNGETIPSDSTSLSAFVAPSIAVAASNMDMQSGSLILAPGATMTVSVAGRVLLEAGSEINLAGLTGVTRSVSDYLYTFKVTANDVADTPLAKSLIGQTVTIDLSLTGTRADGETWVGSPLFASSGAGYLANVTQNINQLLTKGGSLSFGATDVITASGSVINVSGGWIAYTGATISTSRVIGADGRSYNIGSADPFMAYVGVDHGFTRANAHWGISQSWTNLLTKGSYYKASYIDGISAGSLSVTAVNPVLEGDLVADIVTGTHQLALGQVATGTGGTQLTPDQLPNGGSLTIKLTTGDGRPSEVAVALDDVGADILGSNFTLGSTLSLPAGGTGLSTITYGTKALSQAQLGSITITGARDVSLAEGASLSVRDGGKITLTGVSSIDGTLRAHAGSISLTGFVHNDPTFQPLVSALTIGSHALLDVSGLWINDSGLDGQAYQGAAFINGGSVSISTEKVSGIVSFSPSANGSGYDLTANDLTQSIVLAAGSVIDLSSGGYVGVNGKIKTSSSGLPAGNGGSLSLITYVTNSSQYGGWASNKNQELWNGNNVAPVSAKAASITLGGTIYAGGLNQGGTFTLQAPVVNVDGTASGVVTDASTGTVTLPTGFFTQGFSTYKLTSTYGSITVASGTTLTLKQQNYLLTDASLPATGARLRDIASLGYALDGLRGPVNLSLSQSAFYFGSSGDPSTTAGIVIGEGASILADPKAAITATADGSITVLGAIVAPSGSIALTSTAPTGTNSSLYTAAPVVWIGADAVLDVSGIYVPDLTETAYKTGSVLDGGSITISSTGTIVALEGSAFNLQGTSTTIQAPARGTGLGSSFADRQIWSSGGALTLSSSALYFDGVISAAGGAAQAAGGTLNVSMSSYSVNSVSIQNPVIIAQSGRVTSALAGATPPRRASALTALLTGVPSGGFITADTINAAGLDSVALTSATLAFAGDVGLNVRGALYLNGNIALLPAGVMSLAAATPSITSTVNLDAGYIRWVGVSAVPASGGGTLNLNATAQIDLAGVISASYANAVNLSVTDGDIRFLPISAASVSGLPSATSYGAWSNSVLTSTTGAMPAAGALIVPGDLTLTAREVYPATNTAFLLMSLGTGGTITFKSNGQSTYTPLSAGGAILVDAKTIVQAGALYAPLGTIQLGYSASQSLPAFLIGSTADTGSNSYDPVGATWVSGDPTPGLSGALNAILSGLQAKTGTSTATVTTDSVTLASGSMTSTSANGVYVPYGTTTDGANWVASPPTKLIVLAGNAVTTQVGAVIDERGGGDVYATEFVPGTGGSRNVLATPNTYALVPSYQAAVAAYDTTSGGTVALGTTVTLAGGNGIAAGTYVLMPAQYATMPGAYRVVVVKTDTGSTVAVNTATADGSVYMTGTLGSAITGSRSSATALLQIQPNATWTQYAQIDIARGDSYFANLAATNGTSVPRLARDGGQLVVAAANALTLNATNLFAPADGGRGGQVDITGTNMLVVASDLRSSFTSNGAYSNYLILDADQLSNLGVESLLIGGTRGSTSAGTLITATAQNLEIATDDAHALTGPDLLMVTLAPTSADPNARGLTVDSGSVVAAKGAVSTAASDPLILGVDPVAISTTVNGVTTVTYTAGVSGDGSLLRISNGGVASVTRNFVPGLYAGAGTPPVSGIARGSLAVGDGVTLSGVSLTLDSSGSTTIADSATLTARNYDLAGAVINLGGGAGGLVLNTALIGKLAGADIVSLRSASVFNLYGGLALGTAANPIGTLTLDGAGFASDGGGATITAGNIVIANSRGTANTTGAVSGAGGALLLEATDTLTFGAGTKSATGLASVNATAANQILFTGSGSFDAASAAVTLTAPFVVVAAAASQSLTTTGALALRPGAEHMLALAPNVIGGSLTLTGGSVANAGVIIAQSGKVTLKATTGDVTFDGNGAIIAAGTIVPLNDVLQFTPGGTVKLIADNGNVMLGANTLIDVSAAGTGYAGALGIQAENGTATLVGTLNGTAASNDKGGSFILAAKALNGGLPLASGFTSAFEVALGTGDITIAQGQTLIAQTVLLQADGGWVNVLGTIDASGKAGGSIGLYGTKGVDVEGSLIARASAADELGGTITLGTVGTPTDGSYNPTYGYQNVAAANAGSIVIGASAVLDVTGGTKAGLTGGTIHMRAPLLDDGSVKVSVAPTATLRGARAKTLEAYAVWSTTDATSGPQHFDGIVDPAGWYDQNGNLVSGTFTDINGNTVLTYTAGSMTADQLKTYLTNYYFTPDSANADHQTFYGYANGTESSGAGTLMGFVQNGLAGTPTVSGFTLTPGIDLRNPSASVNAGNITVATNWNLGAQNSGGTLLYRYNGNAPVLTLRAANNVKINASITDGFAATTVTLVGLVAYSDAQINYEGSSSSVGGFNLDWGMSASPSDYLQAPYDPSSLGLTGSSPSDQYYFWYQQYVSQYLTYYNDFSGNSSLLVYVNGVNFVPDSVSASLNVANNIYNNIQSIGDYNKYLTAYKDYYRAFYSWAASVYIVSTVPDAPLPPPALTSSTVGTIVSVAPNGVPNPIASASIQSPITSMSLASEANSASYRIVAGSNIASANPLAVKSGSHADVVVDGHLSYVDPISPDGGSTYPTISVGTLVRTGTGAIDIAASGNFILADTAAPGAVYTAGTAVNTPSDFTAPATAQNLNGLVSTPGWAQGGGSITVDVGGDIVGVQSSSLDGPANWASWYYHAISSNGSQTPFSDGTQQTAAWVNYASYGNGIGALGGGNVTLNAGGTIKDIIVSLPESILVAGGTSPVPTTTKYTYGGGNLNVTATSLVGSAFLVGDGTGSIRVVGSVTRNATGKGLQLGVQDSFLTLIAGGDIALSGIYDPAVLNTTATDYTPISLLPGGLALFNRFTSYSQTSGVSLISVGGDVVFGARDLVPATIAIDAISGDITTSGSFTAGSGINLIPSSSGTLSLLAGGSIKFVDISGTGTTGNNFTLNMLDGTSALYVSPLGTPAPAVLSASLHANDEDPVLIYAGEDLYGTYNLIKQAKVYAGRDIVNVRFTGQNNRAGDITSIIAGRDIRANAFALPSTFVLYGPGDFVVEAGRNLGPFTNTGSGGGIFTVGDGSNCVSTVCGNVVKPYLPIEGANITTLFGVGSGMDVAAAIAAYVDPATAKTGGIDYLPDIAKQLGVNEGDAWAAFQALPAAKRKLVLERAFLDFLTQVNADYNDAASPYHGQYARAYQAIATLFPASRGYTDNSGGGSGGTPLRQHTGDLRMARSLIETQTGGDINILGPGGNAYVGSNSADQLSPSQQGILTLQGGAIRSYTDGDVQVYQSRIFTEQGGNVELFSANGDLNAGKGPKSSAAYPPLKLICDTDGYCRVSPAGLVTGAGVGALLSIPGQDPTKSNTVLSAPHGTVDFGAAGVRAAGNLTVVALQVLNAFNAQVGGVTIGVPTVSVPNVGALTSASNAAGSAAQQATTPAKQGANAQPSVIIVEVIGFGGDSGDERPANDRRDSKRESRVNYDPRSALRILGNGPITSDEGGALTDHEKELLRDDARSGM